MPTSRLLAPALAGAAALCAAASLAAPALAAPPAADALLARSAAALQKATSLHLDLEAHTTAKSDGSLTPAQLKKAAAPVDITAHGDLSQTVVVLSGKMGSGGQALAAEARISGKELYINFMGTWYGAKGNSADSGLTLDTNPKDLSGMLSDLLKSGMKATVKDGPTVDGVATWEVDGTFSGPAIVKALKQAGASSAITPADAKRLAAKADVTILVGKDDDLPRQVSVVETLSGADLASAGSASGGLVPLPKTGAKGVKSVTVTMDVSLSKFGQKVVFERPATFKPLEDMFGALLGGLGSLGGSGSSSSAKKTA